MVLLCVVAWYGARVVGCEGGGGMVSGDLAEMGGWCVGCL